MQLSWFGGVLTCWNDTLLGDHMIFQCEKSYALVFRREEGEERMWRDPLRCNLGDKKRSIMV